MNILLRKSNLEKIKPRFLILLAKSAFAEIKFYCGNSACSYKAASPIRIGAKKGKKAKRALVFFKGGKEKRTLTSTGYIVGKNSDIYTWLFFLVICQSLSKIFWQ